MKKIFVLALLTLSACLSMNAQVANTGSFLDYHGGSFYQNGQKLTPEQVSSLIGQQTFDSEYRPGKAEKTAGVICLCAGGACTVTGIGLLAYGLAEKQNLGEAIAAIVPVEGGLILASAGAASMLVGGILNGVGNKKLRNIARAYNGGIALAF